MTFFSGKKLWNRLKHLGRNEWLMILLGGLLLLVIAIPTGSGTRRKNSMFLKNEDTEIKEDTKESGGNLQEDWLEYRDALEKELEEVLSKMDDVGRVRVMITLKDSGSQVLDKNVKRGENTSETSTVLYEKAGDTYPYVTNCFSPEVEGVLVVCDGGKNAVTVSNISDAVMALFDVEVHKIKIVKMSD